MTQTIYNLKPNSPDPDEEIEIGINIISKSMDIYDTSDGGFVELPHKDFLIFIKTTRNNFNDSFIREVVKQRGYGKAFIIRNYWLAIPENQHPF